MDDPIKIPDALELKPVTIDGRVLHTHAWRHEAFIYAYTTEPDGDGRYLAVTLSLRSGQPVAAANFATRDEAEMKAVREYAAVAYPGRQLGWTDKE